MTEKSRDDNGGGAESARAHPSFAIDVRKIERSEAGLSALGNLAYRVVSWFKRGQLPISLPDPPVESLAPHQVDRDALPENVRNALDSAGAELEPLGFHSPVFHTVEDHLHQTVYFTATYAHAAAPVVARVRLRIWWWRSPPKVLQHTELLTAFEDGTFLLSIPTAPPTRSPSGVRVVGEPGAAAAGLFDRHGAELNASGSARPLPAASSSQALEVGERLHAAVRDDFLRRRVYREPSPADLERARSYELAAATNSLHAPALAELARVQHRPPNRAAALVILLVSLLLFVAVGLPGQTMVFVLTLVPILLFHELGHLAAMRAFKYRNLRMLFLPGLGAAAVGHAFHVPGWKRGVVSLMGPAPGIVLGAAVGALGVAADVPWLVSLGLLTLVINGFNLIPVLPLDGGQLLHAVLFSRHPALDVFFRVVAAVAIVWGGLAFDSRLIWILAVPVVLGIPTAITTAAVVRDLRREGPPIPPGDGRTIPLEAAVPIIDRLRRRPGKPAPDPTVALQAINVYEALHSRPPGWLTGGGLLAAYAALLVLVAVFTVGIAVATRSPHRPAPDPPPYTVDHSGIQVATAERPGPEAMVTIVATWSDHRAAADAWRSLEGRLASDESAALLGQSMLLRTRDGEPRQRWYAELTARAVNLRVGAPGTSLVLDVQAEAPDDASASRLADDLREYFDLPLEHPLIPPWSRRALTHDERLARHTFYALTNPPIETDSRLLDLRRQLLSATRRRDTVAADALHQSYRLRYDELHRAELARIAADRSGAYDPETAAAALDVWDRAAGRDFYAALVEPAPHRQGVDPNDPSRALSGYADRDARVIGLRWVEFHDPTIGAPALLRWLAEAGCVNLRYELREVDENDDE